MTVHEPLVTVLCVDDEQYILNALKRTLRREKLVLQFATSGEEALEIMERQPADIVITDMKMPEMSGDILLKTINDGWPDAKKLLLSGYTEKAALANSVNYGGIDCFLEKPWDNQELIAHIVTFAQEIIANRQEQHKVAKLQLNCERVKARNETLEALLSDKPTAGSICPKTALWMLSVVVKINPHFDSDFAENVARTCGELATQMELSNGQIKQVVAAGKLCELGLIGINDQVLKPFKTLSKTLQNLYFSQTRVVHEILNRIPGLSDINSILTDQFVPASSKAKTESYILAVARDYWKMRTGKWQETPMTRENAKQEICQYRGIRYDEEVVKHFVRWLDGSPQTAVKTGLSVAELEPGMVVTADVCNNQGAKLLPAGLTITTEQIERLKQIADTIDAKILVRTH